MLRAGTRLRPMAGRVRGMSAAAAWNPGRLPWDVNADAVSGRAYSAASGGSLVTTDGTRVNGWSHTGTLSAARLGNLTSATGPVYRANGGVPYLEFVPSGSNGRALGLDITSASSGNMTVAVLVRVDAGATNSSLNRVLWSTQGTASGSSGRLAAEANGQFFGMAVGYDSTDGTQFGSSRNPLVDNGWHIVVWRRTAGSPSTWDCWLDGRLIHSGTTANTQTGLDRWNVGGPMYGEGLVGDVAAFHCVRGTAITDDQIGQLNTYYLAHPLMSSQTDGVILWCGDSVSTPQNAVPNADGTGTWALRLGTVRQVAGYLRGTAGWTGRLYNQSRGGWSTSQHRAAGELATGAAWLNRSTGPKVLVINTGVNDIRTGGSQLSPADSYAQILGLKSDYEALVPGLATVIGTIQDGDPTTYTSLAGVPYTTRCADLNALITGGATTNGYTAVDLTGTVPGRPWGASGRGGVLTAGSDGLHPIQSGMTDLAAVWGPAIAAVL